jgi:hypothetical protein
MEFITQILPQRSFRYYITALSKLCQTLKVTNTGKTNTAGLKLQQIKDIRIKSDKLG